MNGIVTALLALVGLGIFIAPTFYGLWRAGRRGEWGWFAGIIAG